MTEALIKDIKLVGGKECDRLIKEAFSEENRRRVEHFNKYERPKYHNPVNRKPKLSVKEIMKAYE